MDAQFSSPLRPLLLMRSGVVARRPGRAGVAARPKAGSRPERHGERLRTLGTLCVRCKDGGNLLPYSGERSILRSQQER